MRSFDCLGLWVLWGFRVEKGFIKFFWFLRGVKLVFRTGGALVTPNFCFTISFCDNLANFEVCVLSAHGLCSLLVVASFCCVVRTTLVECAPPCDVVFSASLSFSMNFDGHDDPIFSPLQ